MLTKLRALIVFLTVIVVPVFLNAAEPVQLVDQTIRSVTFEVIVPQPVFKPSEDGLGVSCSIEGFSTYFLPGKPGIVSRSVLIAVPPDSSVEIDVAIHSVSEFKNIDIIPVQIPDLDAATFNEDSQFIYNYDEIYQQDEYYPAQAAALQYTGTIRGQRVARVLITPLQYNPVQRSVYLARSMTVTLTFPEIKKEIKTNRTLASPSVGNVFDSIQNAVLLNPDAVFTARSVELDSLQGVAHSMDFVQSSPFSIKILTAGPGIYKITYEDISALGVDLSGLTNSNLKVENLGMEVAVYRSGTGLFQAGDYILFYVEDFQSEYSSKNTYWLFQGTENGLAMQTRAGNPDSAYPQIHSYFTDMHLEQNTTWRRNLPDYTIGEDEWFWSRLNIFGSTTHTITFTMSDFAIDAGPFDVEVYLRGMSAFGHCTQLSLNGILIDDFEWFGTTIERRVIPEISPLLFNEGLNTLTIEAVTAVGNDSVDTPDSYYVNWANIVYHKRFVADDNRLAFGSDSLGGATIEVSGFTDPDISIFDVSQPLNPALLIGIGIETIDGESHVRFENDANDSASTFYATTTSSFLSPVELIVDTSSNLQSLRDAVDYIIITHAQFATTVEQLKTIREQAGLNVEIVDVQDIYDEFSYGIKDVTAIKDFLQFAYYNWHAADHPTYVVLVGDATYDYRDNLGLAAQGKADLIPTYLGYRGSLGTSEGATASDNWFVCVDGDDPLPDMIIGRLCVKQNQDLLNIIEKIEVYESVIPDDWHTRVVLAADKDDANIFEKLLESLQVYMPSGYTSVTLSLRDYGTAIATATSDFIEAISRGALITNYAGHGSTDTWSNSAWFRTPNQNTGQLRDDVALLTNTDKYTFLIVLNCLSGMFSEANDDFCIAEEFVRQQQRGAIASVAPSGSGLPSHHRILGTQMYDKLFNNDVKNAGALFTAAKIDAYQLTSSMDLLETFNFFGDPALELKVAASEPECETDFDCDSGFECIDGACSDNTIECAVNDDCSNGVCIKRTCVLDQINKCKVKAGKNDKGDSIKFSGLLGATEDDFDAVDSVIVSIEADDIPNPAETIFMFEVNEDSFKKGKYKLRKTDPVDKSDSVTKLQINTIKGKIKFSGKKLDLTGLRCPITITIQIGDYVARTVLGEDIVNGTKKLCPPELMDDIKNL